MKMRTCRGMINPDGLRDLVGVWRWATTSSYGNGTALDIRVGRLWECLIYLLFLFVHFNIALLDPYTVKQTPCMHCLPRGEHGPHVYRTTRSHGPSTTQNVTLDAHTSRGVFMLNSN